MTPIPPPPSPVNERSLWLCLFLVTLAWCWQQTGIFGQEWLNLGGLSQVGQFFQALFHPDLSRSFLQLTAKATLKTLAYAVCGTTLSLIAGSVCGVLSSQIWWESYQVKSQPSTVKIWFIIRAFLAIPRAIHEMIWGLFFVNIFGLDPLVGILAIALPFGAITAKVFSEILDETPRDALNALLNAGVSPAKAFLYSLIPQAFPNLLSYAFYRFECSIRSAAILGLIGAGGLGSEIALSLQSLRYEQMWTLFWALVLLTGVTDFWSGLVRRRSAAPIRLDLNVGKGSDRPIPLYQQDPILKLSVVVIFFFVPLSFWSIQADFAKLWQPRTYELLSQIFQDTFPPDLTQTHQLLSLCGQTLAMSILAMTGAGLGGILLSFAAAIAPTPTVKKRNLAQGMAVFVRFILLVTRAIPAPIWALILLYVLFPGILPGAIALGLYNLGILGRLMAEAIENLDHRPARSLSALGATPPQVFLYAILPATFPRFLAYILYRWEVCIRATVIVGLVGAGGLGRLLAEQLSSFDYSGVVTTLIGFTGLTFLVDLVSARVRRSLR